MKSKYNTNLFQLALLLNAKPKQLHQTSSKKIKTLGTKIIQYQISELITIFLTHMQVLHLLVTIARPETVDNHGLLLHRNNQFLLAIPLNAKQRQLLMQNSRKILTHGIKITQYQTLVSTMIFLTLIAMPSLLELTARLETVDNHGLLPPKSTLSQLATQLNAKQRPPLMPSSRRTLIHGTRTTPFQTLVLTMISLIHTAMPLKPPLIAKMDIADNHG